MRHLTIALLGAALLSLSPAGLSSTWAAEYFPPKGDGGIADRLRRPDEGEDGAMGIDAPVHVEQPDTGRRRHRSSKGRDHSGIAALGDVRDALDNRIVRHGCA